METGAIILFDGICNLCNSVVRFVIRRDRAGYFKFASLQSAAGRELLSLHALPPGKNDSFLLLENDRLYDRSTAALRVTRHLNGLWPLLYGLIVVPPFLRNGIYDLIARYRYRWFGRKETCDVPGPGIREKFLIP